MAWEHVTFNETINGEVQEFKHAVDAQLIELCRSMHSRTDPSKRNRDVVVAVSGQAGIGKSNTVNTCGYVFGNGFSLHSHVIYDPRIEKVHEFVYNMPPQSFMNVDEAIRIAYRRRAMSAGVVTLNELLAICRKQNKVSMFSIPNFFQLDSDVRKRILLWVYMPDVTVGNERTCIVSLADNRLGRDTWNEKLLDQMSKKLSARPIDSDPKEELEMLQKWPNYWFEFKIRPLPKPIDHLYDTLSKTMIPKLESVTPKETPSIVAEKYREILARLVQRAIDDKVYTAKDLETLTGISHASLWRLIHKPLNAEVTTVEIEE